MANLIIVGFIAFGLYKTTFESALNEYEFLGDEHSSSSIEKKGFFSDLSWSLIKSLNEILESQLNKEGKIKQLLIIHLMAFFGIPFYTF